MHKRVGRPRSTHCKNGHELPTDGRRRRCLVCRRTKRRERRLARQRVEQIRREKWQGRKQYCVNGHRQTQKIVAVTVYDDGHVERRCRMCQSERDKFRYLHKPARREAVRERARAQYAKEKGRVFSCSEIGI